MRYALQRYLQVCKAQRIRLRGSSHTSAWAQASHRSSWAHCKCIQWQPGTFQAFHSVKTGTGRACQPARVVCCPLHVATCPEVMSSTAVGFLPAPLLQNQMHASAQVPQILHAGRCPLAVCALQQRLQVCRGQQIHVPGLDVITTSAHRRYISSIPQTFRHTTR